MTTIIGARVRPEVAKIRYGNIFFGEKQYIRPDRNPYEHYTREFRGRWFFRLFYISSFTPKIRLENVSNENNYTPTETPRAIYLSLKIRSSVTI